MAAPPWSRRPVRARLRITPRSAVLAVAIFGVTLALLAAFAAATRVIGWILVAAVLTGLLTPIVALLHRFMRRGLAVAVVMLGLVGLTAGVSYGVVDEIRRETRRLQQAAPERAREIERSERFGDFARDIKLAERTQRFVDEVPDRLRGGTPAEAIRSAATRAGAFLATGVLTIFFLLHAPRLAGAAADQIRDPERRARAIQIATAVYPRAFGYAVSALAMALAAGLFAYAVARMADVPGPAPLAIWVGLWDLVPVAGATVGALPIVILAAATSGERAIVLALMFIGYQLAENLLVQRRVEAATVKVGSFVTLAAGLVGLEFSGIAGALLMVLGASIIVAIADETTAP